MICEVPNKKIVSGKFSHALFCLLGFFDPWRWDW